jgi:hypothetical protein
MPVTALPETAGAFDYGIQRWFNHLMGENQRLNAKVTHTLWHVSREVFVESYRILHDQSPSEAIFDGERLMRVFEIVDQPRLGPIPVFRRPLELSEDGARAFFSGNTSPYVEHYDSRDGAPVDLGPETIAERETPGAQESLSVRLGAIAQQRTAVDAPASIDVNDVLWDTENLHDWLGVRYLESFEGRFFEVLTVVSVDFLRIPRRDRAFEVIEALSVPTGSLIVMEYQNAAVHLNNRKLFQVRRRARLTDDEYIERYVG